MKNFNESINCVDCKRSARCFKQLIPSELEFINQYKTQILYKKGENICKQGAFASYVLYISEGLVKLYLEAPADKFINLKILKASEFVGLSSIYGDNIYNYSTKALTDSVVCLIEKASLKKLLMNNGSIASEMIRYYCVSEEHLFGRIQSLGYKQMHGRLADTLIYLCSDELKSQDVFSCLSRKDIAEFSGLSTESTVRLLTKFRKEKIIEMNGKEIIVLNPQLLHEISRRG